MKKKTDYGKPAYVWVSPQKATDLSGTRHSEQQFPILLLIDPVINGISRGKMGCHLTVIGTGSNSSRTIGTSSKCGHLRPCTVKNLLETQVQGLQ